MITRRATGYGVRVWDRATQRRKWLGTYPTLREARLVEADWTTKPAPNRVSKHVHEWATAWLTDYVRPAPATQRTYRYATQQIVADIGDQLLAEISRPDARKLANQWPRGTTRVARTMFADAMRDGLIDHNPFSELRLETPKGRKDLDALTEPDIAKLADIAQRVHGDYGDEARAIILTLAYVGVRPGELCALRHADLDTRQRELTVRYNLDASGQEKAPKNGKPRVVIVPAEALDALQAVPKRVDSPYLFHTARGRRLSKGNIAYLWRPIAAAWREHDPRAITPYWMRHSCATLLLERGVSHADVAVQLGHTDGGRLSQILYGHPSEDFARDRLRMATGARAVTETKQDRRTA